MTRLRRFRLEDAEATHSVFVTAVHEGAASRYSEAERIDWVPDLDMPDWWGEWLDEHITWVAEGPDGRLAGFMMLERNGYLNMAFVKPDRMGTGLADRLYGAILEEAMALGLLRLTTLASRFAQSFFRRHGWQWAPEIIDIEGLDHRQGPGDDPTNRVMVLQPLPR